jgi:hypothetical protein
MQWMIGKRGGITARVFEPGKLSRAAIKSAGK